MCNKAVGTYPSAAQFVSECYKSQEMCDKAVDSCPFVFDCSWSLDDSRNVL